MGEYVVGLVALYRPQREEINNFIEYIESLDYCFLLDDSGFSNEELFEDLLKRYSGKLEYHCNAQNIGLCASVNNGFKLAEKYNADWVLVMNPDGSFQSRAVDQYRNYIQKNNCENIAILAPRYNLDRRKREAKSGAKDIKYADMSGCLFNMRVLNELNYYDPKTYFYGLDVEYCLKAKRHGFRIVECSEIVLNHNPAETYTVKLFNKTIFKCGRDNPQRYYYQFRSIFYINSLYHDWLNLAFGIYKMLKVIFLFDNKKDYFKHVGNAFEDFKRGYFGSYYER